MENKEHLFVQCRLIRLIFISIDDKEQAVRSSGDLTLVGGTQANAKDYVCPDGCVCFRMTAEKTGAKNFYKGKYYQE